MPHLADQRDRTRWLCAVPTGTRSGPPATVWSRSPAWPRCAGAQVRTWPTSPPTTPDAVVNLAGTHVADRPGRLRRRLWGQPGGIWPGIGGAGWPDATHHRCCCLGCRLVWRPDGTVNAGRSTARRRTSLTLAAPCCQHGKRRPARQDAGMRAWRWYASPVLARQGSMLSRLPALLAGSPVDDWAVARSGCLGAPGDVVGLFDYLQYPQAQGVQRLRPGAVRLRGHPGAGCRAAPSRHFFPLGLGSAPTAGRMAVLLLGSQHVQPQRTLQAVTEIPRHPELKGCAAATDAAALTKEGAGVRIEKEAPWALLR